MIGQRFARILAVSRRKAAVCPSQSQFFDEQLILVDEEDRIQGCLSKLKVSRDPLIIQDVFSVPFYLIFLQKISFALYNS